MPLSKWVLPKNGFPYLSELYLEGNPKLFQVPHTFEIPLVHELRFTYAYHCCIWEDYVRVIRRNITTDTNSDADIILNDVPTVIPTDPPDAVSGCELSEEHWNILIQVFAVANKIPVVDPETCEISTIKDETAELDDPDIMEDLEEVMATVTTLTGIRFIPEYKLSVRCSPPRDPFNPCKNLLDPWILKIAIWAVWVLALLGNGAVLFIGIASRDKLESYEVLICALAVADILMAVYLAFLAIVDVRTFGSSFYQSALDWQLGSGCKAAGFIAVFSSELSIYLLVMLTLERVYTLSHSFNQNERKRRRVTVGLCILGCLLAAVLAVLPIADVNSYNHVAVCLPYLTESFKDRFYIGFILTLNFVGFLIILFSYIYIFWIACRSAPPGNNVQRRKDVLVASFRIAVVIITAFLCWAPIAVIGYWAIGGVDLVDASQARYFIVFVYPLNACINPFIYAFFTKRFRNKLCNIFQRSKDKVTSFPPNSHLRIQRTPSAFTSEYQMSRVSSPGSSRHEELMKLRQSRRSSSLVVQMVDTSLSTPSPSTFKPPTGCNLGRRASLPPGFGSTLNMAGSGLEGGSGQVGGPTHYAMPFRLASSLFSSNNSSLPNLQEESDTEMGGDDFGGDIFGEQKSNPLTSSQDSNLRRLSVVEEENEGDMLGGGNSCAALAGLGLTGVVMRDAEDCFSDSSSEDYSDASDSIEHFGGVCVTGGTDLDNVMSGDGQVASTAPHSNSNRQAINLDYSNLDSSADTTFKVQNSGADEEQKKGVPFISSQRRSPLGLNISYLSALELANNERKNSLESSASSGATSLRHSKAYSSEDIYAMISGQQVDFTSTTSNQANIPTFSRNVHSAKAKAYLENRLERSSGGKSEEESSDTSTSPVGKNSICHTCTDSHQNQSFTSISAKPSPPPQQDQSTINPISSSPSEHNSHNIKSATASSLSPSPSVSPAPPSLPLAPPSLAWDKSHIVYHKKRRGVHGGGTNSNLLDSTETDV